MLGVRPSVCLSVPSIDRCSLCRVVGLLPGAPLTGHIDRQRRVAGIQQQGAQQHGGQQQMRAVARLQPP